MDGQLKPGNREPRKVRHVEGTSLTRQIHQNSLLDVYLCCLPLSFLFRKVNVCVVWLGSKDDRMFLVRLRAPIDLFILTATRDCHQVKLGRV